MGKLQGKIIVITGGGRGIGLAIAEACGREGARIALMGRHQKILRQAARQISGDATAFVADVKSQTQIEKAFRQIRKSFGHIDVLVNNAGVFTFKPFARTTLADWRSNIETNLTGLFLATRAALPLLSRSKNPQIVNILSVASRKAFANCSAYAASKFGALGLTRVLAQEFRGRNIRVTAIMPGVTDTRMADEFDFKVRRDQIMRPEDVAGAVLSALLSPLGATIDEIVITPSKGNV